MRCTQLYRVIAGHYMDVEPLPSNSALNDLEIERSERIAYLADMVSEMQTLATREGCATLAGLLALSHAEAQRQVSGSNGPV
jgi:hypothetical protein